jgi:hypothetical protein
MSYRVFALRSVASLASKSARALQSSAENPTSRLNRTFKKISRIGAKKTARSIQATRKQNALDRWKRHTSASDQHAKLQSLSDPKNKRKYQSQAARTKFKLSAKTSSYISKLKKY